MRSNIFLVLVGLFILPLNAQARLFHVDEYKTHGPLTVRSQNPLYLQFINQPLEKATTLTKKNREFSLGFGFSNIFENAPRAIGIGLDLDMEYWRQTFRASYGLTHKLELGVELPFANYSAGFMDSFIQGYHSAFGFPNGGRNLVDNGRFAFLVTRNGTDLYRVSQVAFRNGDSTIWGKLQLFDETKTLPALAIRTALKLPTGSADSGTGSNRPDFGFCFLAQKSWKRFHSYTQLGFQALGGHPELNPILRKGSVVYGQAIEFNLFNRTSLVAQINGQSTHFKHTHISELSQGVLDLTVGLTGEIPTKNKTWHYEFGFGEDPTGDGPSVDFTVNARLGVEF